MEFLFLALKCRWKNSQPDKKKKMFFPAPEAGEKNECVFLI